MLDSGIRYSATLRVPVDKIDRAREIVQREIIRMLRIENDDGCHTHANVLQNGVWFHDMKYSDIDQVEVIAKCLLEELEIDEPFRCAWARVGDYEDDSHFGGGAMIVRRGMPTIWVDADTRAREIELMQPSVWRSAEMATARSTAGKAMTEAERLWKQTIQCCGNTQPQPKEEA
jgi:hypothetical protein